MTVPHAGRAAALAFSALVALPLAILPAAAQTAPPAASAATRIQQIHQMLHITPAQEADFRAFVDAFQSYEATIRAVVQQRPASTGTNALESMRFGQKFAAAQAEGLQRLIAPFAKLYTALSPSQKEAANRLFVPHRRAPGHG